MRTAFEPTVHGTIAELAEGEWNALVGEHILATHGWLRTVEETSVAPVRPRYLAIRVAGRLVAGAIGYHLPRTEAFETPDHLVFGRLRRLAARAGLSLSPFLTCCPWQGYGLHLAVAPDADEPTRRALEDALLDGIEAEAAALGASCAFVNLLPSESTLLTRLRQRGYLLARGVPLNVLEIAWTSFDAYLRHLDTVSRGARKDIRRQINQNRKRGVVVEGLEEVGSAAARLHELLDRNSRKHNGAPFPYRPELFAALRRNLGEEARLYVARKGDVITAVSVVLRRGATAVAPWVGVDHALAGKDFTYFNVAHYRPIADAIAGGAARILIGRAFYELKARRGCTVVDTVTAVRPVRRWQKVPLRFWLPLLSAWNLARLPSRVRYAPGGRLSPRPG